MRIKSVLLRWPIRIFGMCTPSPIVTTFVWPKPKSNAIVIAQRVGIRATLKLTGKQYSAWKYSILEKTLIFQLWWTSQLCQLLLQCRLFPWLFSQVSQAKLCALLLYWGKLDLIPPMPFHFAAWQKAETEKENGKRKSGKKKCLFPVDWTWRHFHHKETK